MQRATRLATTAFLRRQAPRGLNAIANGILTSSYSPSACIMNQTVRGFSAGSQLVELLQREHAEEMDMNSLEVPPDLVDLQKEVEADWKVVVDGANVRLHRDLSNSIKVQVAFHCQDTIEDEEDFLEEEPATTEDDEEVAASVRLSVALTKAGQTLAMTCLTTPELSVSIQSAAVIDGSTTLEKDGTLPSSEYQGPEFVELAEDLQESFHNYLIKEVGFTENFVAFITMTCDYQEQKQYVQFLENAQKLLK